MATASACFVEREPTYPFGTFELYWSLDGRDDPRHCAETGAASIAIEVFDRAGYIMGSYGSDCGALGTSIELDTGRYSARATLLDASDRARTTTVEIAPFFVQEGVSMQVFIDFPSNSFL